MGLLQNSISDSIMEVYQDLRPQARAILTISKQYWFVRSKVLVPYSGPLFHPADMAALYTEDSWELLLNFWQEIQEEVQENLKLKLTFKLEINCEKEGKKPTNM